MHLRSKVYVRKHYNRWITKLIRQSITNAQSQHNIKNPRLSNPNKHKDFYMENPRIKKIRMNGTTLWSMAILGMPPRSLDPHYY